MDIRHHETFDILDETAPLLLMPMWWLSQPSTGNDHHVVGESKFIAAWVMLEALGPHRF